MKSFLMLIIMFLFNCSTSRTVNQYRDVYYFYFDVRDQKLEKYYSYKKGPVNYMYLLDTDNIVFTPKISHNGNIQKRTHVSEKDTLKLNIKHFSWLNQFNNLQRDSLFLGRAEKKYFILEKDSLDNKLYLISVDYVQEIN